MHAKAGFAVILAVAAATCCLPAFAGATSEPQVCGAPPFDGPPFCPPTLSEQLVDQVWDQEASKQAQSEGTADRTQDTSVDKIFLDIKALLSGTNR